MTSQPLRSYAPPMSDDNNAAQFSINSETMLRTSLTQTATPTTLQRQVASFWYYKHDSSCNVPISWDHLQKTYGSCFYYAAQEVAKDNTGHQPQNIIFLTSQEVHDAHNELVLPSVSLSNAAGPSFTAPSYEEFVSRWEQHQQQQQKQQSHVRNDSICLSNLEGQVAAMAAKGKHRQEGPMLNVSATVIVNWKSNPKIT